MKTADAYFDDAGPQSQERSTRLAGPAGSGRRRRALARHLRAAVTVTGHPSRAQGCQVPLLLDRVVAVRCELLELARELEDGSDHDATNVSLACDLLRDGASPLYDPNVPVSTLHDMLSRTGDAVRRAPSSVGGGRPRKRLNRTRWMISAVGAIGLAVAVGVAGPAAGANGRQHTFTETVIAVSITPEGSKSVSKITDSVDGPGAGTTTSASSSTSYPFTGTDTNISYFANGVQRSTDTFTIEKPDAHGISKFTGKGKCTGGTRTHKTLKCTFTESGTVDTAPGGVAKIKVVGTYSA